MSLALGCVRRHAAESDISQAATDRDSPDAEVAALVPFLIEVTNALNADNLLAWAHRLRPSAGEPAGGRLSPQQWPSCVTNAAGYLAHPNEVLWVPGPSGVGLVLMDYSSWQEPKGVAIALDTNLLASSGLTLLNWRPGVYVYRPTFEGPAWSDEPAKSRDALERARTSPLDVLFAEVTNAFRATDLVEWARQLPAQGALDHYLLAPGGLPPFIASAPGRFSQPTWIVVDQDPEARRVNGVMIEYGGGFVYEGIGILLDESVRPPSAGDRRAWEQGIYVYMQ